MSALALALVMSVMLSLVAIPQNAVASTSWLEAGGAGVDTENADGSADVINGGGYFYLDTSFDPNAGDDDGGILVAGGDVIEATEYSGGIITYERDYSRTDFRTEDADNVDGWFVYARDYSVDSNHYKLESTHTWTDNGYKYIESTFEWDGKMIQYDYANPGGVVFDKGGEYTSLTVKQINPT